MLSNGAANNAIVLYNKALKHENNPFVSANTKIKPGVQVFQKINGQWKRIGLPVEVERANSAGYFSREFWAALKIKNRTYDLGPEHSDEIVFYID